MKVPSRFVTVFSILNVILAVAYLLPPHYAYFSGERAYAAIARSLQGPVWFASYSLLQVLGALSPLSHFVTASLLGFATALAAERMWVSGDELTELLPSLALLYLAFGFVTTVYGGVLVESLTTCAVQSGQRVGQSVTWYTERGWSPGAHYFLLDSRPPQALRQLEYVRLDQPAHDPCAEHEVIAIFPLPTPQ